MLAPDGTPVTKAYLNTHERDIDVRRISAANPTFAFTKIPMGTYSIRVTSRQGWILMDPVELRPGEHLDIGEHTLKPFGTIRGTTPKQLLGRSLQVEVQQIEFDHYLSYARKATVPVDEDGSFSVARLRTGKYTLALMSTFKDDHAGPSKLGIEAIVTVKSGEETQVALEPSPDNVLVKGQVRYRGKPLANSPLRFVDPTIATWRASTLRNIQTDSEGRFLVWLHPNDVFWVIAALDGDTAILAKEVHAPLGGKEITWEVPTANLVVNMVDATGEPIEFVTTIGGSAGATLTPQACGFHAPSYQDSVGSQVRFEHLAPGTKYTLFAAGKDSERKNWISIPGQTFTCSEQGESHSLDLVLEPPSE